MAENDVGGIGVKFTADAAQLKQELTSLEQRLRAFNEAHGQTKVKLQAGLVMPGNRVLQDFRRDIEKSFQTQGAAGPIKAHIELLPPTAAQIKVLKGQVGKIEVDVIGNFKWGNKPPKKITVEVEEKRTTTGSRGSASTSDEAAPTVVTSSARKPVAKKVAPRVGSATLAKAEIERSRVSPGKGWLSPQYFPDAQQLVGMLLEPGGGQKRAIREELVRRGMTWPQIRAIETGGTGGTGGSRGFINAAARSGFTAPRIASTGVTPLSSSAIRRMQGAGELPLPYAQAGLYDPTVKRASLTTKTMPSEEEIRSRTRHAMSITPRERMEAGERWWPEAARVIAGMGHGTGLKGPQMAGVAATATNALDWPGTIRVLDKVFSRLRDGAMGIDAVFGGTQMTGRDRLKAMNIIQSSGSAKEVEGILRGPKGDQAPKVAEMFRGFMGDPNALPMDRHFQALTVGGEIPTSQIRRVREIVASEMRAAGRQPAGTMAGMWETIGGGEPFGPDPWGQLRARVPQAGPEALMAAGGGARGFAAPAWQKNKSIGMAEPGLSLLDATFNREVAPTGRPGVHIERANRPRGWNTDPRRGLYSVARNEAGEPLGALEMALGGKGHDVRDIMPFVDPGSRGQGIGSSLYAHAQRAGFDVEGASDRNAASAINRQTEYGQALWASRKRRMGLDPEEYRQEVREREKIHVPTITFPGGARGFAAGGGGDDPYNQNILREQRGRMHEVQKAKADADLARWQARREEIEKQWAARGGSRTPEEAAEHSVLLREMGIGEPLGPGGQVPLGMVLPPRQAVPAAAPRPARARPAAGGVQGTLGLAGEGRVTHVTSEGVFHTDRAGVPVAGPPGGGPPPRSAYQSPFAGPQPGPGNQWMRQAMGGSFNVLPGDQRVMESGLTAAGLREATLPRRLEEAAPSGYAPNAFVGPTHARETTAMMAERFGTFGPGQGPPITAGTPRAASVRDIARPTGVDLNNPETAAYLRKQQVQQLQAAEPEAAGPTLQEFLNPPAGGGGGGGGGGKRPTATGAGGLPDDFVGQPTPSERLTERFSAGGVGTQRERIQSLLRANREAVQLVRGAGQVRAVGTTTAGIFANIFGGKAQRELLLQDLTAIDGEIKRIQKDGESQLRTLDQAAKKLAGAKEAFRVGAGTSEEIEKAGEAYKTAAVNAEPFTDAISAAETESAKLMKQLNGSKAAAIGFASSIAGTLVGLAAFQGVTIALEKVVELGKESIDMMSGFTNEAGKVGTALGQTTRQMNGFAEGAVSASFAQAGLGQETADSLRPALEQRAALSAANSALEDQITLIKAGINTQMQNRLVAQGRAPGPLQSPGSIPGISASMGGWLNSPLFGQTPLIEQLAEIGPRGTAGQRAGMTATGGGIGAVVGGGIGLALGLLGGPFAGITVPAGLGIGTALGGGVGLAAGSSVLPGMAGLGELGLDQPGRWEDLLASRAQTVTTTRPSNPIASGRGAFRPGAGTTTTTASELGAGTELAVARVEAMTASVEDLGEAGLRADRGIAGTVRSVSLLGQTGEAAEAKLDASSDALRRIGVPEDQIESFRAARIAFEGEGIKTRKSFTEWWENAAKGLSIPSREEAVHNLARPILAQLSLNQEQGRIQREQLIPGQSFLRALASGRAPGGARGGVNIPNPLTAGTQNLPPELLNRPGIDTSQLTEGLGLLETHANKGRDALVGMIKAADNINRSAGLNSNLLDSFNQLTAAAGQTAATIRSISQASAWMQVNLQVKQINEQIYLMNRSLQDAKSFLSGAGEGELGLLQHRARGLEIAQAELGFRQQTLALLNQELGITASQLQLQQRQRQINFQRAVAGFVTPGQTPEEIAARQREATLEADFAQRQQDIGVEQLENQREAVALQRESLGISKEQFAVQQAMITVSAERAVGDLGRAIGLLQEQARVTVQLQVNADAVAAYQEVLEAQMAAIESVITEANNTQQTILSASAQLIATYAGTVTSWNNLLIQGLQNYLVMATDTLAGRAGAGAPGGNPVNNINSNQPQVFAPGFLGSVSSATPMIVGEAGTETVAILRNPRMTMGSQNGDSGGISINVMVTGNNVGSEQDAEALANQIARKVEESMSRRSSLLGLRSN